MTPGRLAALVGGLALSAVFVAGAAAVGTAAARRIAPGRSLAAPVRTALGLVAFALVGSLLGLAGLLHPPLVVALALAPGSITLIRWCLSPAKAARPLAELAASSAAERWLVPVLLATGVAYVAAWTLPTFHHDVVSNYVGVPAAYLVSGSARPLPWSVFSAASLALHGLLVFPVALDTVLPEGPFRFGWAAVWGGFHLLVVAGGAWALADLVARLAPEGRSGPRTGIVAVALWLTIPQSLLLASLELVEFVTTFVALAMARHLADPDTRGDARDGVILGVLGGFLVAAKPQLGAFAAVAVVVLAARSRSPRPALWAAAGAVPVVLPQLLRNAVAYGAPLFPWLGGSGPARAAADDWLAVNAVGLPESPLELLRRTFEALTVQPEAGIAAAFVVVALAARPRQRGWPWALVLVPLIATAAASDAAYHVLRWSQASLALLAGLAAIGLVRLLGTRRWGRAALAAGLLAALLPAVRFTCGTIGGCAQLAWPPREVVGSHIPSLEARAALAALPGTVLYLGELDGFYGVDNGILPSPHDGRAVLARYASPEPAEIHRRLLADGIGILAVDRAFDRILGLRAPWTALSPEERAAFTRLLTGLEAVPVPPPVRAYRIGPTGPPDRGDGSVD